MTMKEMAFQVEELELKAHMLRDTLMAVNDAVFMGSNSVKEYEWAFYAVTSMAHDLRGELAEMRDQAFQEIQKGEK